jgi:hypothetical protein
MKHNQYQFLIEHKGKASEAMVPVERLEQMQQAARLHLLSALDQKSEGISQSQADQLANEAKHGTRRPRRK